MKSLKSWLTVLAVVFSTNALASDRPEPPSGGMGKPPSFSEMDKNSDGVLTSDEVQGPMRDHFSDIDTDGNGKITETEFSSHRPPEPPQRR